MNPEHSSQPEYQVACRLETYAERLLAAQNFIDSLPVKPLGWRLSGSSANGTFRPDSDVDIEALYERNADIPFEHLENQTDPTNGLVCGYIDFHYFAKDWGVYQHDTELLKRFEQQLNEAQKESGNKNE